MNETKARETSTERPPITLGEMLPHLVKAKVKMRGKQTNKQTNKMPEF